MTLDRQPDAAAERRLEERATNAMTPMRTTAPMTTQSQMSAELDPLPGAGELLGWAVGTGAVAFRVADGCAVPVAGMVALGTPALLLGTLTLLLGTLMLALGTLTLLLAIAPPATLCPHPAARNPRERIAAKRTGLLVNCRMPDPSVAFDEKTAGQDIAVRIPLLELPRLHPLRGSFAHASHRQLCERWSSGHGTPSSGSSSAASVKDAVTLCSGRRTSICASRTSMSRSALVSGGWVTDRGHRW